MPLSSKGAKITLDREIFYSVAETAKLIGSNGATVRELIEHGKLDAHEGRPNSKRFLISGGSIIRLNPTRKPQTR